MWVHTKTIDEYSFFSYDIYITMDLAACDSRVLMKINYVIAYNGVKHALLLNSCFAFVI